MCSCVFLTKRQQDIRLRLLLMGDNKNPLQYWAQQLIQIYKCECRQTWIHHREFCIWKENRLGICA